MPSTPKPHTSVLPLRLRWYRTLSSSILWDWACPISPGEDTWPGRRRVRIEGCAVINAGCLGCCQGGGKGCRAGPDGWGLKHKLIRHGPWICSTSTLTLITDRNPKMGLCICPNRQNTQTHTYTLIGCIALWMSLSHQTFWLVHFPLSIPLFCLFFYLLLWVTHIKWQ